MVAGCGLDRGLHQKAQIIRNFLPYLPCHRGRGLSADCGNKASAKGGLRGPIQPSPVWTGRHNDAADEHRASGALEFSLVGWTRQAAKRRNYTGVFTKEQKYLPKLIPSQAVTYSTREAPRPTQAWVSCKAIESRTSPVRAQGTARAAVRSRRAAPPNVDCSLTQHSSLCCYRERALQRATLRRLSLRLTWPCSS